MPSRARSFLASTCEISTVRAASSWPAGADGEIVEHQQPQSGHTTQRNIPAPFVYGLLGLPAGVALGFLTLELVGLPLLVITLAVGRRRLRRQPAEMRALMLAGGSSFGVTAGLAWVWSIAGRATGFAVAWDVVVFLIGLCLVTGALLVGQRSRSARWEGGTSS